MSHQSLATPEKKTQVTQNHIIQLNDKNCAQIWYNRGYLEEDMIQWESTTNKVPIKAWCADRDEGMVRQAENLANHPAIRERVCLMPDAHVGKGMPIGGVIACENALIPNAVGVDIGCGMGAIRTNIRADTFTSKAQLREIINSIKERIPVGEGRARKEELEWDGFEEWRERISALPSWWTNRAHGLDRRNLGTLGGGNHFIEIQKSDEGDVWLMLHSGSRNMGQRVAQHYHDEARKLNAETGVALPDSALAFLPADTEIGQQYIRDMNHALAYAMENRRVMMAHLKTAMSAFFPEIEFVTEVNIHHNYAALETHEGKDYWIHRKGATSARLGETGIIPGSMGTPSYIVEGLGNPLSFMSCSHGAGRKMSRGQANRELTLEECNTAMGDIVFDRFQPRQNRFRRKNQTEKREYDLSEAPLAYKNIDTVIKAESDLVKTLVRLQPLAVVKG
jgi:tRNA-splicing ligase RtcB